ncbi:MAG: hypothetical protein Hals2KO_30310 [Halioglobus sp.]
MRAVIASVLLLFTTLFTLQAYAEDIISDGGISLSREEVEFIVKNWPSQMQKAGAVDVGDRIELLNRAVVDKKIAADAEGLRETADPDLYWKHVFAIRNTRRDFVTKEFMRTLEVPDMTELARERYVTEKEKFALVPETRLSSHVLVRCTPPRCVRVERRKDVEAMLEELLAGKITFDEMVKRYSDDPGSKMKGGRFSKWIKKGEPNIAPPYVGGVFEIEEIGGYSGVVETQFGFHIIRLDGIKESHYKPYEEVADRIIATLEGEYRKLSAKAFDDNYRLSEDAKVDTKALDEIFAPYLE